MAKQGEHCARCGAKCTKRVGDYENHTNKVIYECPNKHGIQLIEDLPPEATPTEAEAEAATEEDEMRSRTDYVAGAVDHGPGSHN